MTSTPPSTPSTSPASAGSPGWWRIFEGPPELYGAAVVASLALASYFAFQPVHAGAWTFAAILGGVNLALAVFSVLWLRHEDGDLAMLTPRSGDLSIGMASSLILFAGAYAMVQFVATPGTPREAWIARIYLQLGSAAALRENMLIVVALLLAVSVSEEVIWRGLMPRLLETRFGSRRAWMLAAVLYALAHAPTLHVLAAPGAGLNPMLVLGALGAGLVWGAFARIFGRLGPGIISHAMFDWTVVVMFRLWGKGL